MQQLDLRRLGRKELLELLLEQTKKSEALEAELASVKEQMEDRRIRIEQAGSIAEASLRLNNVFADAQKAADDYLDSVKAQMAETEAAIEQQKKASEEAIAAGEAESRDRIAAWEAEARDRIAAKEAETAKRCEDMLADAQSRADVIMAGLREMLDAGSDVGSDVGAEVEHE